MSRGNAVDYAVASRSHMSTFSQMDMPFLFRDLDHWNKVLEQDLLEPIAEIACAIGEIKVIRALGDVAIVLVPMLGVLLFVIPFPDAILALPRPLVRRFAG